MATIATYHLHDNKNHDCLNNHDFFIYNIMITSINEFKNLKMKKLKVALFGTCNNSTWREELIPLLKVDYFNPVVLDWKPEDAENEIKQREICDFILYVITPKMTGVFAIAELTKDAILIPEKTIICFLETDGDNEFDKAQLKSINATKKLIEDNTEAICFNTLKEIADYLNLNQTEL